ncbi:hypothetical protein MAR_008887, partial [Mya arenaria]
KTEACGCFDRETVFPETSTGCPDSNVRSRFSLSRRWSPLTADIALIGNVSTLLKVFSLNLPGCLTITFQSAHVSNQRLNQGESLCTCLGQEASFPLGRLRFLQLRFMVLEHKVWGYKGHWTVKVTVRSRSIVVMGATEEQVVDAANIPAFSMMDSSRVSTSLMLEQENKEKEKERHGSEPDNGRNFLSPGAN